MFRCQIFLIGCCCTWLWRGVKLIPKWHFLKTNTAFTLMFKPLMMCFPVWTGWAWCCWFCITLLSSSSMYPDSFTSAMKTDRPGECCSLHRPSPVNKHLHWFLLCTDRLNISTFLCLKLRKGWPLWSMLCMLTGLQCGLFCLCWAGCWLFPCLFSLWALGWLEQRNRVWTSQREALMSWLFGKQGEIYLVVFLHHCKGKEGIIKINHANVLRHFGLLFRNFSRSNF